MSKQGPLWEQAIVKRLQAIGIIAFRIDKSGDSPAPSDIMVGRADHASPVFLFWKRYLGKKSNVRRSTKTVVVMDIEEFYSLRRLAGLTNFWIEAKASQSESVTTVLKRAEQKVRTW